MHITDPILRQDLQAAMRRMLETGKVHGYRTALQDMKKRRGLRDIVCFTCGSIVAFIGVLIQ